MPRYQRQHPQLIDPAGVQPGIGPRPIGTTSDLSRAEAAYGTGGQPLVDFEGRSNPYNDYQSIDLLLSLQHPRSEAYDEMCFFVMGQVKELLFKALHFELYNAQAQRILRLAAKTQVAEPLTFTDQLLIQPGRADHADLPLNG